MNKKYKIYVITNSITDKKYIGFTSKTLEKRLRQHFYSKDTRPLKYAIDKHGRDNFKITLLEQCDSLEEAKKIEIEYIKQYKTYEYGYNATRGGETNPPDPNKDHYKDEKYLKELSERTKKQHKDQIKKKRHVEGIQKYWNELGVEEKNKRATIAIENGKKFKISWNKGKKFPGTGLLGSKNPMAKKYKVIFPDGSEKIIDCLKEFCRDNNLTYRCAQAFLEGKVSHHKNFKFYRMEVS